MTDNQELKALLYTSGWREERHIGKEGIERMILDEGFEVLPKVVDFLASFDGITIYYTSLRSGNKDDLTISFEKGTEHGDIRWVTEDYAPRIGKKLCVVGTASRDYMVLAMDEDGKLYGGYDAFLLEFGDTGIRGIEAVVYNLEMEEIQ